MRKQLELDLKQDLPRTGGIDSMEFALVIDTNDQWKKTEYLLGTYEEIEAYCDKTTNLYVDRYLDYVAPSSIRQGFKYVGSGKNPYELQRGFNYDTSESIIDDSF